MKAIGKNIIIEEIKEEIRKSEVGLLMGEAHKEDIRYRKGVVLHPGNDVTEVKEGHNILFDRHAGHKIEIGTNVFKVILEKDIVVVL